MCTQYLAWTCSKIIFNFKTIWVYIEKRWLLELSKAVPVYSEYDLKRKPLRLICIVPLQLTGIMRIAYEIEKRNF